MKTTLYVSCTQKSNKEQTLLWRSLNDFQILGEDDELHMVCNNSEGLSKVYNRFITPEHAKRHDRIVFVHDDVCIDDLLINEKLNDAMYDLGYDIVGVAGTRNPKITHPALWHIMGDRADHRGYAGHLTKDGKKFMTGFGQTPDRVMIVDGLFVAVKIDAAIENGWKWNENFTFHHYDIASCIDANNLGLRIGVYPINIFHQSHGLESIDNPAWSQSNKRFIESYA